MNNKQQAQLVTSRAQIENKNEALVPAKADCKMQKDRKLRRALYDYTAVVNIKNEKTQENGVRYDMKEQRLKRKTKIKDENGEIKQGIM